MPVLPQGPRGSFSFPVSSPNRDTIKERKPDSRPRVSVLRHAKVRESAKRKQGLFPCCDLGSGSLLIRDYGRITSVALNPAIAWNRARERFKGLYIHMSVWGRNKTNIKATLGGKGGLK